MAFPVLRARNPGGAWHFLSPGHVFGEGGLEFVPRGWFTLWPPARRARRDERKRQPLRTGRIISRKHTYIHTDAYAKPACLHDHLPNPEVYMELRAESRALAGGLNTTLVSQGRALEWGSPCRPRWAEDTFRDGDGGGTANRLGPAHGSWSTSGHVLRGASSTTSL